MKKKISSIFLAAFMLCSVLSGCFGGQQVGDSTNAGNGGNKDYVDVTENDQHLVDESKRLHRNKNNYSNNTEY